jgi:nucleotidyltransferase/DNA polymerase involved in DNA repair
MRRRLPLLAERRDMKKGSGKDGHGHGPPDDEGWRAYESVFTNRKAGMDEVDRDRIKKVVYEASKNSPHFKNEQRKEQQVEKKVSQLQARAKDLLDSQVRTLGLKANKHIAELEAARDLTRVWFHVDMDMFYAAVEILDDPGLQHKPMAVGGMGMISTANYAARKFGVRSAMPGFIAIKLCPHLTFVKPDFSKYTQKAKEVRAVLMQYDPNFIVGGLDEAYLDVTSYLEQHQSSSEELAQKIRSHVHDATSLTCSIGVGANRMLAKICSDINKPNGQFILASERSAIVDFMSDLPTRKIPGIGKMTEKILRGLKTRYSPQGISLSKELVSNAGLLSILFSASSYAFFVRSGLGIGSSEAVDITKEDDKAISRKGISCERTFRSLQGPPLEEKLKEICENLSGQMLEKELKAKHMTLKMKRTDFVVKSRCRAMASFTNNKEQMLDVAKELLRSEKVGPLRLIGVRMAVFEQKGSSAACTQTIKDILEGAGASNEPGTEEEAAQLSEKEIALMAIIPAVSISTVRRLLKSANGNVEVALTLHFDMNLSAKPGPAKKLKNKRVSETFQKEDTGRGRQKRQKNEIVKGMNTILSYFANRSSS